MRAKVGKVSDIVRRRGINHIKIFRSSSSSRQVFSVFDFIKQDRAKKREGEILFTFQEVLFVSALKANISSKERYLIWPENRRK